MTNGYNADFDYRRDPDTYDAVTGKCLFCRTKHSYRTCMSAGAVEYRRARQAAGDVGRVGGRCEVCKKVGSAFIVYTKRCSSCFQKHGDAKPCTRCGKVHPEYAGGC